MHDRGRWRCAGRRLPALEALATCAIDPAVVAGTPARAGRHPGLDVGDHLLWEDYTRNYTSLLADDLYRRAGLGPDDIQFAELYDCFSSTVLASMGGPQALRPRRGRDPSYGAAAPPEHGRLPTNTNGGLLAEGYLHGMNTVAEAVLQIQSRCGPRQAPATDVGIVTSGALMEGSALILTADRIGAHPRTRLISADGHFQRTGRSLDIAGVSAKYADRVLRDRAAARG